MLLNAIGPYRILKSLEKIVQGECYLAEDNRLKRQVALQILRNVPASEQAHFRAKMLQIARLDHAHIIPLSDFGMETIDGTPIFYLVIPFSPTGSLGLWLKQRASRQLPPRTALHIIQQAAEALQYLHQQGITHGAVSPDSFWIDTSKSTNQDQPFILLADFSGADFAADETLDTRRLAYLAPEQVADGRATPFSDQYALASIAYELLAGKSLSATSNISLTRKGPLLILPDTLDSHIHGDVEQILQIALAKQQERRFRSISAFANALAQALNVPPEPAPRTPPRPKFTTLLLFFSYAPKDQIFADELEEHLSNLKYRGLIATWHEKDIGAGEDLEQQIDNHLEQANLILLLLSSSFMSSDYYYGKEMAHAMERHKRGEARVLPILLRPVLFTDAPFAMLTMLPSNKKPIATWRNRDQAFVDVALGIERVIHEVESEKTVIGSSGWAQLGMPQPTPYPTGSLIEEPGQTQANPYSSLSPAYDSHPQYPYGQPSLPAYNSNSSSLPMPLPARRHSAGLTLISAIVSIFLILGGSIALFITTHLFSLTQHGEATATIQPTITPAATAQATPTTISIAALSPGSPFFPILVIILVLLICAGIAGAAYLIARRKRRAQDISKQVVVETTQPLQEEVQRQVQEQDYYEKALTAYDQALLANPRDALAYKGKGNALASLARYDEALQALRESVNLAPSPLVYTRIGDVYGKLQQDHEALAAYKQAIKLDPSFALAYAHQGTTLEHLGKTQEAKQAWEKATQLGYEE